MALNFGYACGNTKSLRLCKSANGKDFTETLKLPSGGDTSYAGMVVSDNFLWISYYSSHEGKTAIYLAKVAVVNQQ